MSILSVRLPRDLERAMPRKDRSAWVIDAIRERLRRERIGEIARAASDHADEELAVLEEWSATSAPVKSSKARKARR